jgi:uncharacterized protein (DUF3084 family)
MRFGNAKTVLGAAVGLMVLAGVTAGCGPTQAEKDLNAKMENAASRTEMAANKAEAAARSASEAAQRAEAAAQKAEAIFQKHMRK